jgi:hypothetical protein
MGPNAKTPRGWPRRGPAPRLARAFLDWRQLRHTRLTWHVGGASVFAWLRRPRGCWTRSTRCQSRRARKSLREILRRTALAAHGSLEDAELVVLADEVLRESNHAEEPR